MKGTTALRVLLVFVFLFTQTAGVLGAGTVNSNSNTNSIYTGPANNGAVGTPASTVGNDNNSQAALDTANSLANYYLNFWKDNSWDWLRRTQFSGQFGYGSPQWTLSTIQPFNNIATSLERVWYGSGSYATNTSTMNLGVGYRQMNSKHSSVYGANLFYDNQFQVNNLGGGNTGNAAFQRVGAGLEYFTGPLEATINGYLGISAPVKVADNGITETWQNVANGLDLSLKSNLSYFNAPWLSLMLTGYQYFGSMDNSVNANGGHFGGLNAQIGWQVTPQLSVNLGRDFGYQSTTVGFSFNLLAAPQPAMLWGDKTINDNATKDLSYKMLQQPLRNSTITVEQYQENKTSNTATLSVTLTDDNNQPLSNVTLTLTPVTTTAAVSADGVSYTATTNSSGVATFSGIYRTTYRLASSIPYSFSNPVISVNSNHQNTPADAAPKNPVSTFNILVVDAATGYPVTGATISAQGVYAPITETATSGTYVIKNVPAGTYTGKVTCSGYNQNSFTFTPTAGGNTTVSLTPKQLQSITVAPATSTVTAGSGVQYTATGNYSDGSTADITSGVTWSSSNIAAATINSAGLATGEAAGTATISAVSGSVSGTATLTVTAKTLNSIVLTSTASQIAVGSTAQYTATGTYSDGSKADITSSVTWVSSNTAKATISSSGTTAGLATGIAAGTTGITAALGSVSSAAATLTVTAAPVTLTSITVTSTSDQVAVGATLQYKATGVYSDGSKADITSSVTWVSSNTAKATISSSGTTAGLATGIAAGTTGITAALGSVSSAAATLTVTAAPVTLTSITVTSTSDQVAVGATLQYKATGVYSDGSKADITSSVTWVSSNTVAATISSSGSTAGLATGVATGVTGITATSGSVSSVASTLTVISKTVDSITLTCANPSNAVQFNSKVQYAAVANYSDGTQETITSNATWSSSDTGKVTVSSAGLARSGTTAGTVYITVAYGGKEKSLPLVVYNAVTKLELVIPSSTMVVNDKQTIQAFATYQDGTRVDVMGSSGCSITCSPTSVLSKYGTNQIVANSAGDATVIAYYKESYTSTTTSNQVAVTVTASSSSTTTTTTATTVAAAPSVSAE